MGTDVHSVFQKKTADGWVDIESQYGDERHYALFAWIGNVRNGFGFAGVPTHDRIEPLSDSRGFPDGFTLVDGDSHPIATNAMRGPRRAERYKDADNDPEDETYLRVWMGGHSYSWLTADEILGAEPPRILRTGIVSINTFRKWDGVSSPTSYCGAISGDDVSIAESPSEVNDKTTDVRIEWFDHTADSFAYFIDEVRRLKELHGDVRFVFGFDS